VCDASDLLAERIRSLVFGAPASFSGFGRLASVPDEEGAPEAMEMVRLLVAGHEAVINTARGVVAKAEGAGDVATADLVTTRIEIHEKTAWILRATVPEGSAPPPQPPRWANVL